MDTTGEQYKWETVLLSFAQLVGASNAQNLRAQWTARFLKNDRNTRQNIRNTAELRYWQLLLWNEHRVYLHPTQHARVRKNKYGDKYRKRLKAAEYLQWMKDRYLELSSWMF
ncbi:hypothetical protein [Pacific flying fox faeces associated circular DNA virus-13]|nr:hypothetical protein [Pacific flying fox faeces associated circular DNA virus-13]